MNKRKTLLTAVVAVALLSIATIFLRLPAGLTGVTPFQFRTDIVLSVFYSLIYLLGAFMYLSGLGGFTNKLRSVYVRICVGTAILGLTFFQLPILNEFNLWGKWWATSGAVAVPFALAGIIIYWGTTSYAHLINTRTIWAKWPFILVITGVASVVSLLVPHITNGVSTATFDFGLVIRVVCMMFMFAASLTVLRIRQDSGSTYGPALAWFFTGLLLSGIAFLFVIFTIIRGISFTPHWFITGDVLYVLSALLWLKGGYAFTKISTALNRSIRGTTRK